jgi:hypothetical protein
MHKKPQELLVLVDAIGHRTVSKKRPTHPLLHVSLLPIDRESNAHFQKYFFGRRTARLMSIAAYVPDAAAGACEGDCEISRQQRTMSRSYPPSMPGEEWPPLDRTERNRRRHGRNKIGPTQSTESRLGVARRKVRRVFRAESEAFLEVSGAQGVSVERDAVVKAS